MLTKGLLLYKYGCEISINAKVDPHTLFMHTVGVVIGEGCIVGGKNIQRCSVG